MPPLESGYGEDIFPKAGRVCSRTDEVPGHPPIVDQPDKVQYGPGEVYEIHFCGDGGQGILTKIHPDPPGPEVRNPKIVDTRPGLEEPL